MNVSDELTAIDAKLSFLRDVTGLMSVVPEEQMLFSQNAYWGFSLIIESLLDQVKQLNAKL